MLFYRNNILTFSFHDVFTVDLHLVCLYTATPVYLEEHALVNMFLDIVITIP